MEDRLKHALQLLKEAEEILWQCSKTKNTQWQTMTQMWKGSTSVIVNSMQKRLYPIGPL